MPLGYSRTVELVHGVTESILQNCNASKAMYMHCASVRGISVHLDHLPPFVQSSCEDCNSNNRATVFIVAGFFIPH